MRRLVLPVVLAVSALTLVLSAQERAGGAKPAQAAPKLQTFTGTNIDGNVQLALNDALQKAQQSLSKTTADAQFRWQLDSLSGTRGGITGSQACEVVIHIVP
ncbi:MAG: hypothetical protein IPJ77_14855 [Planctomycetes bacterium]|nr:hypothetical protein [Planctomycetota bacterium]